MTIPLSNIEVTGFPALNQVIYKGVVWDLSHLAPYAFHFDIGAGEPISIVVVFACHCFTRDATDEELTLNLIQENDWYIDAREKRVLDEQRYLLSRQYLPTLVHELKNRRIIVADDRRGNFVTFETVTGGFYSVYFEVSKEKKRRLLLRIQSAYVREGLTRRESQTKPVKLKTLLKAAFEGRKIRP